jgi:hypothetical protein
LHSEVCHWASIRIPAVLEHLEHEHRRNVVSQKA